MSSFRSPIIVVAPDSFKGSCSARAAARALGAGARRVFGPQADIREIPLADGGEGSLDALLSAWQQQPVTVPTRDALGRPRAGRIGLSPDGRSTLIEAAEANGLPHVADRPSEPLRADSAGVGDLALAALHHGAQEIMLCVGGSASSDGGTGLLTALGARFLTAEGVPALPGAAGLSQITHIDVRGLDPRARQATWRIAVDVEYPLTGPRGAGAVFGPQKGATQEDVLLIDTGLTHLATVLAETLGEDPELWLTQPGFGAAGGLPLCAVALLGAELIPGNQLISDALDLPNRLAEADLILTGEGQLDEQSLSGKVVDLVCSTAPAGIPIAVIAGSVTLSPEAGWAAGITIAASLASGPATLEALTAQTAPLLEDAAARVCAALAHGSEGALRLADQATCALTRRNDPHPTDAQPAPPRSVRASSGSA